MPPDRDRAMTAHRYSPAPPFVSYSLHQIPLGPFAMCEAFPARTTTAPPPHRVAIVRRRVNPTSRPLEEADAREPRGGSCLPDPDHPVVLACPVVPRSLLTARGVRCPPMPLRYRHGYAAGIHRGLRSRRPKPTWRLSRSPTTLANETADVTPVTFERYPSVSFAVSLPSIAHRLPPR